MNIDFSVQLKSLSGADLKDGKGNPFLLRDAAVIALDNLSDEDKKIDAKEKYRRGALAARIYGAKEPINLDLDEVKLIKDTVGRAYGPHIVKDVWDILDPKG